MSAHDTIPKWLPRYDDDGVWDDFYVGKLEELLVVCRALTDRGDELDDGDSLSSLRTCVSILGLFSHRELK